MRIAPRLPGRLAHLMGVALTLVTWVFVNAGGASSVGLRTAPIHTPIRLAVDLNGDLRTDTVETSKHFRALVAVTVTGRKTGAVLHASGLLTNIVARDADRDGDPDLLGLSSNGTLHIWMNDGHGRFRTLRPTRSRYSYKGLPARARWSPRDQVVAFVRLQKAENTNGSPKGTPLHLVRTLGAPRGPSPLTVEPNLSSPPRAPPARALFLTT